jgi:hypothetical protein
MKCCDVQFGSFSCADFVDLPWQLADGGRKTVAIDRCLLPEVKGLWENGIRTTGCCCGHGKTELAYIGVDSQDVSKMELLGYSPNYPNSFCPKTPLVYGETKT